MLLNSVIHSGPVTALYNGDSFILAGIGSFLHVYINEETGNWRKAAEEEVLPGRNIHRIKYESNGSQRLVVFGQKCLRLLEYDHKKRKITCLQKLVEFSDWIWDVCWLQDKTDHICLALGHNVVVMYDLTSQTLKQTVHCEEKCILYCASFVSSRSDALVLAAGTVFNQVVMWNPLGTDGDVDDGRRINCFHRLTGHQGVIFSIDYSPKLQTLCSASDDRSLRLYRIDFPSNKTQPSISDWLKMKSSLLHVLYGHQARVWDVKLLSNVLISVGEDSTCCVWSHDGHVIQKLRGHKGKSIWSISVQGSEDSVATGGGDHSVRIWKLHSPPSILQSSTIDFKMSSTDLPRNTMFIDLSRVLAITNEGNLLMYSCDTSKVNCLMSDKAFSSYTVIAVSKIKRLVVIGNIRGYIRILYIGEDPNVKESVDHQVNDGKVFSVHFITDNTIITTGPNGNSNIWEIQHDINGLSANHLHKMEIPPSRHRWVSTASFVNNGNYLICGDRTGSVFLYKLSGSHKISELVQTFPKIHGKAGVTDICCLGDVVYTCGRDGLYRLYTWEDDNKLICQNSNRVHKGFEWLEKIVFTSEGDILISGFHTSLFVIWNVNQNQKLLEIDCGGGHRTWDYISTETSSRFVYIKTREVKVVDIAVRSNQTVVKPSVHGREICDMKHLYSERDINGNPVEFLMTCSEDTTLSVIKVNYTDDVPQLSQLHTLSGHISSVRCIAICHAHQKSSRKVLVISGGGRAQIRIWQIYVKKYDEILQNKPSNDLSSEKIFKNDSTKDRGDVAIPQVVEDLKEGIGRLDCTTSSKDISCTTSEKQFDNSITPIDGKVLEDLSYRDPVASNLETGFTCLGEVKLGKAGRRTKKPWRFPVENSDPETRVLDLCLFHGPEISEVFTDSLYFFAAACSDGLIRLFAFEEQSREITVISSSKYHNHCVLKTSYIIVPQVNSVSKEPEQNNTFDHVNEKDSDVDDKTSFTILNQVLLLSAATDGKVAFYNITSICLSYAHENGYIQGDKRDSLQRDMNRQKDSVNIDMLPVYNLQLHQSGINSVYCSHLSDNKFILLTGGDDNALTVSYLNLAQSRSDRSVEISVSKTRSLPSAHAAQVTGVWWLDSNRVLSVSIDQRLCLWKIEEIDQSLQIAMTDCKFVNVSDVSNIDVYTNSTGQYVAISGEGLQIFKICSQEGLFTGEDDISKQTKLVL